MQEDCEHTWRYVDFHGRELWYCTTCKATEDYVEWEKKIELDKRELATFITGDVTELLRQIKGTS